jgi:DNA-binding transcriptional ArsR family regulator
MKVRTFAGTDTAAVDQQVNEWITKSKIRALRTNTALQRLKETGKDVITGRTSARRGVGVAISVWYDEADTKTLVDVYRLLVQAGPNGMPVAGVAKALKIAPIKLAFHFNRLREAGLVTLRRERKPVIYAARYEALDGIIALLTENWHHRATTQQPRPKSRVQQRD